MIIDNLMTYGLRLKFNQSVMQAMLPTLMSRDDVITLLATPLTCLLFALGALCIERLGLWMLLTQEQVGAGGRRMMSEVAQCRFPLLLRGCACCVCAWHHCGSSSLSCRLLLGEIASIRGAFYRGCGYLPAHLKNPNPNTPLPVSHRRCKASRRKSFQQGMLPHRARPLANDMSWCFTSST